MEEITIQQFFKQFPMINISKFAEYCGINESQMRQYAIGERSPSDKTKYFIEDKLGQLGNELSRIQINI
jgi:transcriptional regulator with XRE-family HTH domain